MRLSNTSYPPSRAGSSSPSPEQPCCQSKELRADRLFLLSLPRPSCLPWFYYTKVRASQFFRSGVRSREWRSFSAQEGRQALRHPPGQELLDAVLTRRDKHWKLNKRSEGSLAPVKHISLTGLKCHSSYPRLRLCSILRCFWVTKWMALFHRWIVWSETICPVSLARREKKKSLARGGTESSKTWSIILIGLEY